MESQYENYFPIVKQQLPAKITNFPVHQNRPTHLPYVKVRKESFPITKNIIECESNGNLNRFPIQNENDSQLDIEYKTVPVKQLITSFEKQIKPNMRYKIHEDKINAAINQLTVDENKIETHTNNVFIQQQTNNVNLNNGKRNSI